ncbi:TetR/AcrR family transcriptional regulator [Rhodococcus chondri]|uniref:TetR/AcrR family transcriptional regulator n=1 Tax=Rhodococcus chondri TaxID=3065941 RepID=A0ABU7JPV2_9NOCA|nr:TetR/AcrR family transcriptional regulator [Rhodococcus sp. CC-R104]MEE2031347.1 TetR/AcrR family transcriptional regulator [Rhodococcus sp. CC-R104]
MTQAGPGRPRLREPRRPGATARAEILDAAAELFTTRGFAPTSTRLIADAVGVRQASLYNHFTTKSDILVALLEDTVDPTLEFVDTLDDATPPTVRLCALAWFDAAQLCAGRWNLGALYTLPELREDRFAPFRNAREQLARRYRALAVEVLGTDDPRAGLPFRLVESVIGIRADDEDLDPHLPEVLAIAALRVLGRTTDIDILDRAHALVVGAPGEASEIRPRCP